MSIEPYMFWENKQIVRRTQCHNIIEINFKQYQTIQRPVKQKFHPYITPFSPSKTVLVRQRGWDGAFAMMPTCEELRTKNYVLRCTCKNPEEREEQVRLWTIVDKNFTIFTRMLTGLPACSKFWTRQSMVALLVLCFVTNFCNTPGRTLTICPSFHCHNTCTDCMINIFVDGFSFAAQSTSQSGDHQPDCLCKWQGLPYSDCTWEDGELISRNFQQCIDEFQRRNKSQKIPSKSAKVMCLSVVSPTPLLPKPPRYDLGQICEAQG